MNVPASYAVEQAEVEQAQLLVGQARGAIARFQTDNPWTDYARGVLPLSEDVELSELEDRYQQERAKLALAQPTEGTRHGPPASSQSQAPGGAAGYLCATGEVA